MPFSVAQEVELDRRVNQLEKRLTDRLAEAEDKFMSALQDKCAALVTLLSSFGGAAETLPAETTHRFCVAGGAAEALPAETPSRKTAMREARVGTPPHVIAQDLVDHEVPALRCGHENGGSDRLCDTASPSGGSEATKVEGLNAQIGELQQWLTRQTSAGRHLEESLRLFSKQFLMGLQQQPSGLPDAAINMDANVENILGQSDSDFSLTGWISTETSVGDPLIKRLGNAIQGTEERQLQTSFQLQASFEPGDLYEVVSLARIRQDASFESEALSYLEVGTRARILEWRSDLPRRVKVISSSRSKAC